MPGVRMEGSSTQVGASAVIGEAGAVTLVDSQVGEGCRLGVQGQVVLRDSCVGPHCVMGAGCAEGAVFLGGDAGEHSITGMGFNARSGTLFEENARSAQHTDTKMSILFPWVTLGSQINWCDVFISGGTSSQPGCFSEVGSGTVHFNYTPRGDKATGSCLGNVTQGVFLGSQRIFIGGNSSLVGPISADFGALAPAGGVYGRHLSAGLNLPAPLAASAAGRLRAYDSQVYGAVEHIYQSQMRIIAELCGLEAWYLYVRKHLAKNNPARSSLYHQGLLAVQSNLEHRLTECTRLAACLPASIKKLEQKIPTMSADTAARSSEARSQQEAWARHWPALMRQVQAVQQQLPPPPATFIQALDEAAAQAEGVYTRTIAALRPKARQQGSAWLAGITAAVFPAAWRSLAALQEVPGKKSQARSPGK